MGILYGTIGISVNIDKCLFQTCMIIRATQLHMCRQPVVYKWSVHGRFYVPLSEIQRLPVVMYT